LITLSRANARANPFDLIKDAHGFFSGGFQGGKTLLDGVVEKFISK
jgi:hypothetical protein